MARTPDRAALPTKLNFTREVQEAGVAGTTVAEDTAALLAILICRPKAFERDELDVMVRAGRTPKVHDWLVNYVVKKNPHSEELRRAWSSGGAT